MYLLHCNCFPIAKLNLNFGSMLSKKRCIFFENTASTRLYPCCSPSQCCSFYWLSPPLSNPVRLLAYGQRLTSVPSRTHSKYVRSASPTHTRSYLRLWKRHETTAPSGWSCTINLATRFIYAIRATISKYAAINTHTGNWAKSGDRVASRNTRDFGKSVDKSTIRSTRRISVIHQEFYNLQFTECYYWSKYMISLRSYSLCGRFG